MSLPDVELLSDPSFAVCVGNADTRSVNGVLSLFESVIIENSVRTHEPTDWKTVLRCKLTWILDQLLSESQIGECK